MCAHTNPFKFPRALINDCVVSSWFVVAHRQYIRCTSHSSFHTFCMATIIITAHFSNFPFEATGGWSAQVHTAHFHECLWHAVDIVQCWAVCPLQSSNNVQRQSIYSMRYNGQKNIVLMAQITITSSALIDLEANRFGFEEYKMYEWNHWCYLIYETMHCVRSQKTHCRVVELALKLNFKSKNKIHFDCSLCVNGMQGLDKPNNRNAFRKTLISRIPLCTNKNVKNIPKTCFTAARENASDSRKVQTNRAKLKFSIWKKK